MSMEITVIPRTDHRLSSVLVNHRDGKSVRPVGSRVCADGNNRYTVNRSQAVISVSEAQGREVSKTGRIPGVCSDGDNRYTVNRSQAVISVSKSQGREVSKTNRVPGACRWE